MIQAFQKFSQSRIAKIFLAIVALSFVAFFGGGNWFQARDPYAVVAEIGNVGISRYELAEKVQQQMQQLMTESKQSVTREDLLKAGLPQLVLNELIQETLLNLEAENLGLTISDEKLRQEIQSIKGFHDEKGNFDRTRFAQMIRAYGLSEDSFVALIRKELLRHQLINAVIIGAYLPDEMIDRLFEAQYQHRQASMLIVSPQEIAAPPVPDDHVLEAFYKEHSKEFETPELRSIAALIVDPAEIAKEIQVTEQEVKAVYEAKHDLYGKQQMESVRPLITAEIQKEKAIEKIYQITQELDDKLAGGATLEELSPTVKGAQIIKLDQVDAKGRDRMEVPSPNLPKTQELAQELLQSAFSLEEGSDIPFTQAKNGAYYTVRVDKITPPAFQSFSDIKDRILKVWTENERLKAAYAKAEEYVKSFNQGDRKVASMTLLPSLSLSVPSPSVSNEVKSLVFSLRPNRADMTLTSKGFAVVVLNKIIPPSPKIKEEKMSTFKETLLKHYQKDLLVAYVNALRLRYPVKTNRVAVKALFSS